MEKFKYMVKQNKTKSSTMNPFPTSTMINKDNSVLSTRLPAASPPILFQNKSQTLHNSISKYFITYYRYYYLLNIKYIIIYATHS